MKAWLINKISEIKKGSSPLTISELPIPEPLDDEVLIKVSVCGICHTELDEIEGRLPPPRLPVIPGHQVIGNIVKSGKNVKLWAQGDRIGVAWIYSACGKCEYCRNNLENLCSEFKATGLDRNGGYAEYMITNPAFCYKIPAGIENNKAAPLFCAGAIGYRSLKLSGINNGLTLGLSGFGASAHLVLKMVKYMYPSVRIFVFARNEKEKRFAIELGATWAGDFSEQPPVLLNAIIDTTPAWNPVIKALGNIAPAGRLVINAIRKEPSDQYLLKRLNYQDHLWMEKEIKSVANITRQDVIDFLRLAVKAAILPETRDYDFGDANQALIEMKTGGVRGAKVLVFE